MLLFRINSTHMWSAGGRFHKHLPAQPLMFLITQRPTQRQESRASKDKIIVSIHMFSIVHTSTLNFKTRICNA